MRHSETFSCVNEKNNVVECGKISENMLKKQFPTIPVDLKNTDFSGCPQTAEFKPVLLRNFSDILFSRWDPSFLHFVENLFYRANSNNGLIVFCTQASLLLGIFI